MNKQEWLDKCAHWKAKWPVMQPEYRNDSDGLNIYAVFDALNEFAPDDAVFVGDAGSAYYVGYQAINIRDKQRMVFSVAQGDMGWALPAAIGVAKAGAKNVICIVGDGSFMSNMQEMAVIKEHNLPIKIVLLNNYGYLSIKNTQSKFYEGRVYGSTTKSGLSFPSFTRLADAFGFNYEIFTNVNHLDKEMYTALHKQHPAIINCVCTQNQQILPAQGLKDGKQAPLHDMVPFLSDEEMKAEMVVSL